MKTIIVMTMMMLVQMASAHDVTSTLEGTWELTLVTPEEMLDMPNKYRSYSSCITHGIEIMIHFETSYELLLGFVCEEEDES